MPITTAPITYTFAKEPEAFKKWFRKYYPGVDYDKLYSEDKALLRSSFKQGIKPINGPETVTKAQRAAITKKTIGLNELAEKVNLPRENLSSTLNYNNKRFTDALKKSGIKVTMIGDQYRFSNTSATNTNKFSKNIAVKLKYSTAVLNKASQATPPFKKNFDQLTDIQQKNIRARLSQGSAFKKRNLQTALSPTAKTKVLKEFPNAKFDLSKHGFDPQTIEGRNLNANVKDFISRGFKFRKFKPLPVATQRIIKEKFSEIPKDKWDFKSHKYGLSRAKEGDALIQRIITKVNDPKRWRYGFQIQSPGGWMISQMDRASDIHDNPNYKPILNENKKVIGIKDKGVAYYANENVAPFKAARLINTHPSFKEVQKIVDIANIARVPLIHRTDEASKSLMALFPEGFNPKQLTLDNLLTYIYRKKGIGVAKNAIERHHLNPLKAGGDPINPKNLMLLRRDKNKLAETIDNLIRTKGDFSRVPELEEVGAKIDIGGEIIGKGSQDARQYIISETENVRNTLSKYGSAEINALRQFISKLRPGTTSFAKICGLTKADGGTVDSCIERFDKDPKGNTEKFATMEANTPELSKIKKMSQNLMRFIPKLGTPGKIAAGAVAGAAAIGALTYNKELGEFVNPLNDDKASQATVTEWIKDNPVKTVAGTSIGFSTQEIPGAYKKARELGRGRVRSALGITGALKPVLTTFGTPAMTALFEAPFAAKRLEEGESMTEVLTDPLGPALGLTVMETLSQKAGVVRDAPKRTMAEGLKNYFNLSNVGTARPGVTSKILRMGMSPRMIAGASRFLGLPGLALSLGLTGYGAYKNYQNEEGMLYNFFNKDE